MTSIEAMDQYPATVVKSCSRCRSRKVRCDLKVPQCSACERQDEVCNITEYVAYPYALVESLHSRMKKLEEKLAACANGSCCEPTVRGHPLGPSSLPPTSGKSASTADVSKEAEEVGVLAIGSVDRYSHAKYVGAAAGSTFARIFFKQVGLTNPSSMDQTESRDDANMPECMASIPSKVISGHLLFTYIARLHLWWPFFDLRHARSCFKRMYQEPHTCTDYERFTFFVVLALAADEAPRDDAYSSMLDYNTPRDYFHTALHFFKRFRDHPRDLPGLQAVLLVTVWMLNSPSRNHSNDLWHLTRYAMSIALELGIHRHNPSWRFSPEETEIRSRTWWATYSLERLIALTTGRVLSVRDQAIDTPIPSFNSLDQLTEQEAKIATLFHAKSVWIFVHMIELRKIAGRILESIYIARDREGRCSSLTFQEVCSISDNLHQQLDHWKNQLDAADIGSSREFKVMRIEYCMMLMHLNRPSPAFMVPSQNMIAVCSHASSSALHQWAAIATESGLGAVCRCHRQFHDILIVGLVRLYSDWHMQKVAPTPRPTLRPEDAAICLELLRTGIANLQERSLSKFLNMFSSLRDKVYSCAPTSNDASQGAAFSQMTDLPIMPNTPGLNGSREDSYGVHNADMSILPIGPDSLESYLSQMSTIFDNEMLDIDDSLTAWYGTVLSDIGDTHNMHM